MQLYIALSIAGIKHFMFWVVDSNTVYFGIIFANRIETIQFITFLECKLKVYKLNIFIGMEARLLPNAPTHRQETACEEMFVPRHQNAGYKVSKSLKIYGDVKIAWYDGDKSIYYFRRHEKNIKFQKYLLLSESFVFSSAIEKRED